MYQYQLLEKTLDEMLELEPGEDVGISSVAPITAAVISCDAAEGQLL